MKFISVSCEIHKKTTAEIDKVWKSLPNWKEDHFQNCCYASYRFLMFYNIDVTAMCSVTKCKQPH